MRGGVVVGGLVMVALYFLLVWVQIRQIMGALGSSKYPEFSDIFGIGMDCLIKFNECQALFPFQFLAFIGIVVFLAGLAAPAPQRK